MSFAWKLDTGIPHWMESIFIHLKKNINGHYNRLEAYDYAKRNETMGAISFTKSKKWIFSVEMETISI